MQWDLCLFLFCWKYKQESFAVCRSTRKWACTITKQLIAARCDVNLKGENGGIKEINDSDFWASACSDKRRPCASAFFFNTFRQFRMDDSDFWEKGLRNSERYVDSLKPLHDAGISWISWQNRSLLHYRRMISLWIVFIIVKKFSYIL